MTKRQAPSRDHSIDGAFLHSKLLDWYRSHERPLPWRVLFKKYRNPWHIWVSEIMLQQTVIKAVIPVYERFIKLFPSHQALANANSEEIRLAVRGLGYYRRFDLLHKACKELVANNQSLPITHDDWLELPGIGPYTAAAISSIAFDAPQGVVDGNVERVLCRLLDIRTEPNLPPLKKQFKLIMDELCGFGHAGQLNQAVMELGQTLCTPATPNCSKCPIKSRCLSFKNSSQSLAPGPKAKQDFIDVELQLEIMQVDGKFALFQRPIDAKFLKATWGFRTSFIDAGTINHDGTHVPQLTVTKKINIGLIKHSITKHKITAHILLCHSRKLKDQQNIKWTDAAKVESNLVSNLDRKAWHLVQKTLQS